MEEIREGYHRVTDIVSIYQSFAHIPKAILKRACEIGNDVHEAIEAHLNGKWLPLAENKEGYFHSFLEWNRTVSFTPFWIENRLYDDVLKVTGKPDLICKMGDEAVLVDFKTGSIPKPEIWHLQGTFYRYLLKMNKFDLIPNKFIFVNLQKDGSFPVLYEMEYQQKAWEVCDAALKAYEYFRTYICIKITPKLT
jgi:hypothetical protein